MSLNTIILIKENIKLKNLIIQIIQQKNGTNDFLNEIPLNSNWNNEVLICDENDLETNIFKTNITLVEAIEKMDVFMIIIGDTIKFNCKPINVKTLKESNNLQNNVSNIISKWILITQKKNKRERVIANKLHRLFYILNELENKEEVFLKDIVNVTGVSKRTIQRDFQLIREMIIHKDIVFDEYNKSYVINDIF